MPAPNLAIIVKMTGGSLPPNSRAGDVEIYDNGRLVIYETDTDVVERQLDRQQVIDILQFARQSGFFQLSNVMHDGGNAANVPDVTISMQDSMGHATVTMTNYQRLKGEMRKEPFDVVYKKITDTAWDSYTNGKPPAAPSTEPQAAPAVQPQAPIMPNLPFSSKDQAATEKSKLSLPSLDDLLKSSNLDFGSQLINDTPSAAPSLPPMAQNAPQPMPTAAKAPSLPPLSGQPMMNMPTSGMGSASLPPLGSYPTPSQQMGSPSPSLAQQRPNPAPQPQQRPPNAPPMQQQRPPNSGVTPQRPPGQNPQPTPQPMPPMQAGPKLPAQQPQPQQHPPQQMPPQPKPPAQQPPQQKKPEPVAPRNPQMQQKPKQQPEQKKQNDKLPKSASVFKDIPAEELVPGEQQKQTPIQPEPAPKQDKNKQEQRAKSEDQPQEKQQQKQERVSSERTLVRLQMKRPPVGWEHTQELLGRLEESLKGKLLTFYVAPGHEVTMEDMRYLYSHLRKSGAKKTLYVLPVIPTGQMPVVWRMATLLREFAQELVFVLPDAASVYTTMLALSGDTIMMNPLGYLSPIETTFTHPLLEGDSTVSLSEVLQAAQLSSVLPTTTKNKAGTEIPAQQSLHPLTVTAAQRQLALTQLLCSNLLKLSKKGPKAEIEINRIVQQLTGSFLSSDYPITFNEVKDLGLRVSETTEEMNDLLWDLLRHYAYITQPVISIRDDFKSVDQQVVIVESEGRRTLYYKEAHEDLKNNRVLDEHNRWREVTMQLSISQNGKEHNELQWKELQITGHSE